MFSVVARRQRKRLGRRATGGGRLDFVSGQVDVFSATELIGWVEVASDVGPTRIALLVDDVEAAATWAADVTVRHDGLERRAFRLALRDVWGFCGRSTRLSVLADGVPLRIAGHGPSRSPVRTGRNSPADLRRRLDAGYVFGQFGRLQLAKSQDVEWQRAVLDLYARISNVVRIEFGYDTFFCYGTLLGAVRENGFIGHDLDFDAAFVSRYRDGAAAAAELRDIALRLIDAGLDVVCKRTALHVYDGVHGNARVDLFHLYFDEAGRLAFPFGVAGESVLTKENWQGIQRIDFCGARGHVPVNAAEVAEHIYGPNWRVPKPGFHWDRDRTNRAPRESIVPVDFGIEVFWENFYARRTFVAPSPFAAALAARRDLPATVVDLGCGDGRDAIHFAGTGRRVVGVDRSPRGLAHARARAAAAGLPAVFYRRDLRDPDAFADIDAPPGPALFYARFLLHAVQETTQRQVLDGLRAKARPGDQLALEVRTEPGPWAYGKHYRRPVDTAALLTQLEGDGWTLNSVESGTALAPHGDEDPAVLRIHCHRQ